MNNSSPEPETKSPEPTSAKPSFWEIPKHLESDFRHYAELCSQDPRLKQQSEESWKALYLLGLSQAELAGH